MGSSVKTIAVVGISEEETAHLRLLMRKHTDDLRGRWIWGDETGADLLVVDTSSFAGQMARTRAQARGVRCAIFTDQPLPDTDLVLLRPLSRSNVAGVLNGVFEETVSTSPIGQNTADFYTRDLGDDAATTARTDNSGLQAAPARGLDDVLRAEPIELRSPGHTVPPPISHAVQDRATLPSSATGQSQHNRSLAPGSDG